MPERALGGSSERTLENDYFRKQDQELIEGLRRKAEKQAEDEKLMQAFGIRDRDLVQELADLGLTLETFGLLHLVPLIQVAWADGSVSQKEREKLLEIASLRGIHVGGPGCDQLVGWLHQKPSGRFFDACLRGIQAVLRHKALAEATSLQSDLVSHCTRVALASGGFLGLGSRISEEEQRLLTRFATELEVSHQAASQEVVGELGRGGGSSA